MFGSIPIQDVDVETFGEKWRQHSDKMRKMTSKRLNRRPEIMREIRLIPTRVRRYFLAPVGFMEIPVGYARKDLSALVKIAENLLLHTR